VREQPVVNEKQFTRTWLPPGARAKKNRSETKTLLQGEKRVLDKQNEDYRRDSVLSQLTSSKTKTAAAEK
jgi:hypothetical protein